MKLDVVKSRTEPNNKNVLWLSPEGLKRFTSKGWELLKKNKNIK